MNAAASPEPPAERPTWWARVPRGAEDGLLTVALCAMMVLPLAEILLRALFHVGISGANSIVQHLTLVVGIWLVVIGLFEIGAALSIRKDVKTVVNAVRG